MLSPAARLAYEQGDLADVVYADDTLLIGACAQHVEEFLRAVAAAGRAYGLDLHERKFQLLQVGCADTIRNNALDPIVASPSMCYLGANLASDGRVGSELARRIGIAKGDFRSLCKVWRHSSLTRARKLEVYRSLVESRLLYGLSTGCYTKAQLRQIDGFQARCLRAILGVLPSHLSRVSNATVRQQADWKSASSLLLERQLVFLGKVVREDADGPLHRVSFIPGTDQPATSRYVRKLGRPRKEWISSLMPEAYRVAGFPLNLDAAVQNKACWKRMVKSRA